MDDAVRLDSAALLDEAIARSGVLEPASLDFLPALDRLTAAINDNARMNHAGRRKVRDIILDHLVARLRAERYWQDHPEIQDLLIEKPVFVIGMPRTGSTLLVNLFDCDPVWRTILKWQVLDPVPPAPAGQLRTDPRCLAQLERERTAFGEGANPNIHFEWADSPTECVVVHMQAFMANAWEAYACNSDYSEYMLHADLVSSYRWHRKLLQILQSRAPGRWMLKTPSHALYVDALLEVYPDARLVWTHRDPFVAVPSLCSLMMNVHRRFLDAPDMDWIGSFYVRQAAAHVDRAARAQVHHPGQVLDLYYDDLMDDPLATLERAYRWLEMPLEQDARAAMAQWLHDNPQGKFGEHRYSLEQYGLDEEAVRGNFSKYLSSHWKDRNHELEGDAHA
jgi:hypothetical protein